MPPLGAEELSPLDEFSDTAPSLIERFRKGALGTVGRIAVVPLAVAGSAIVEGNVVQYLHPDAAYAASSNDTENSVTASQNTSKNKRVKNVTVKINCTNMNGDTADDGEGFITYPGSWEVDGCNYGGGSGSISPSINAPYLTPNYPTPSSNNSVWTGQVPSSGKSTIFWESGAETTFDYTVGGKLPRKYNKLENEESQKCENTIYSYEFYSISGQVIVNNAKNGKRKVEGSILSFLCYTRGGGEIAQIGYSTPGGVELKVKQPASS